MDYVVALESRALFSDVATVTVDDDGVALVLGTAGRDEILFFREGRSVQMLWRVIGGGKDYTQTQVAAEVSELTRIVVLAGEGNDVVVGGRLRVPFRMYGGPGRDVLSGGARRDLLVGEAHGDILYDGSGDANDYLYGGRGRDRLIASGGNDTLVGGRDPDVMYNNAGADTFFNAEPGAGDRGDDDYIYTETPAAQFPQWGVASYGYWRPFFIDSLGTTGLNPEKGLTDGIYAFRPDGDGGDVLVDFTCFLDGGPAHFDWSNVRRNGAYFYAECSVQGIGMYVGDDFVPYNVRRFNLGPLPDGTYTFQALNGNRGVGSTTFTVTAGWKGAPMPDRVYAAVGWPVPSLG